MSEKFSLSKMLGGFTSSVHWAKTVSFGLSGAFIIFIAIGVWRGYFKKPLPTTEQNADSIENYYYNPRATFGCATVKYFEKYPTNRIIDEN